MLHVQIVTPEKIIFQSDADEVIVPTVNGEIAILPNHVSILTTLAPGEITIKIKDKNEHLAVVGGFVEVTSGNVIILADYAIHGKDIREIEVMEAKDRAEKAMKEKISEQDLRVAEAELRKAILKLKVAQKVKHTIR